MSWSLGKHPWVAALRRWGHSTLGTRAQGERTVCPEQCRSLAWGLRALHGEGDVGDSLKDRWAWG